MRRPIRTPRTRCPLKELAEPAGELDGAARGHPSWSARQPSKVGRGMRNVWFARQTLVPVFVQSGPEPSRAGRD